MAVDLGNLIENLKAEVQPPGEDAFPDATDDDWVMRLMNAFWTAVLDGVINGYTVDDNGIVTPTSGTTDLSRMMQQIVVFYAGIDIVRNSLRTLNISTHSVAGPVEFEITKSANTLRDILKELQTRRDIILTRLSDLGAIPTSYVDAVLARDLAISEAIIYSGFNGPDRF